MKHKTYIALIALFILLGCTDQHGGGKYDDYQEDTGQPIESPYDEGTGHDAGYQWAEQNGITDPSNCGGDSDSFIDGCKEYASSVASDPVDAVEATDLGEENPWEDGR